MTEYVLCIVLLVYTRRDQLARDVFDKVKYRNMIGSKRRVLIDCGSNVTLLRVTQLDLHF